MTKTSGNIFNKITDYFKTLNVNDNKETYALFFARIISLVIFVKEFISFFTVNRTETTFHLYFIIAASLMFVSFFIFTLIAKNIIKLNSTPAKNIVLIFPFIIALMGNIVVYIYIDYSLQIFSYFAAITTLSFIQIYPKKRRIALFSFSIILFNIINFVLHGISNQFSNYFIMSFLVTSISFIIATIHYKTFSTKENMIQILDRKSQEQISTINKFEKTYQDLLISHKITEKMLKITEEILNNENLNDVLQIVLDEAINIIPKSQAGSILISHGEKVEYVAAKGYDLNILKKISLTPDDLFQSILENKYEPTIIENLEVFDEIHLSNEKWNSFKKNNVVLAKSCLTCSFKYNDEFFGSINLDNFESTSIFNEKDKYFIQQLTKEIEIIISIHKLYENAIRPTKIDELTQAYTRKYGIKLLEKLIKNDNKSPYSICFLDINNLKKINDEFGHDMGDKYLFAFSEAVRNVKMKENIFSRVGGDEFLLVFKSLNIEESKSEVEILKNYLKENKFNTQKSLKIIDFSVGITCYPDDGKNILELIRLADKRMYIDKNAQSNN